MRYRAFYLPNRGKYKEEFVDALELDQLPAGAILVVKINDDDGTREVISEKTNRSPKEDRHHGWALRILEKKHDGGPTVEMIHFYKENRSNG